jgi:hypothetical protein
MRLPRSLSLTALAAAVATLAAVPARAEHVHHWYEIGQLIVGSVSVEARGTITFVPPETNPGPCCECRNVVADWTLTNPSGGEAGIGELTSLTFSGCGSYRPRLCIGATAESEGLPQRAALTSIRPPEEKLPAVRMHAECGTGGVYLSGLGVQSTHHGHMRLYAGGSCSPLPCHASFGGGRLKLARNITAK